MKTPPEADLASAEQILRIVKHWFSQTNLDELNELSTNVKASTITQTIDMYLDRNELSPTNKIVADFEHKSIFDRKLTVGESKNLKKSIE